MFYQLRSWCLGSALIISIAVNSPAAEDLASWNDGPAKQSIIDFVQKVTDQQSDHFVEPTDRIAVFDNDGTLWPEVPIPFQLAFAFDELKRRVPQEPDLKADPMVQAALAGDVGKLLEGKHHDGLLHVIAKTHAGMTTDEFDNRVQEWLATARHPRFDKRYTELTYGPMQEVLAYLRANDFKCFIVSGGGADFMRAWTEDVYGIPPENVVGSMGQTTYEMRDGLPTLVKTLDHLFVDDKEGKPVGIHQFIGRRPIACFGNSDGDQAMLEYTTIGNPRPSFGLIVHHTDAQRESAYDANPKSSGKLTTALSAAAQHGWTVVDMKEDWKSIWQETKDISSINTSHSLAAPNALLGHWLAEDIDSQGVIDRAQSTLEFDTAGSVGGNSSVNRFHGSVKIDGDRIEFGPLAMTRRAGPPALMKQESNFMAALQRVNGFRIAETGLLYLTDENGTDILRFSKIDP
tara:strand:+ start:77505 stop:78884 length:1380 start_codon:yes stop_codon:yes gene_type:complete